MDTSLYSYSVPQLLERISRSSPDREALYDGIRRLTFKEIKKESDELAAGLLKLGLQKGDRVAVSLPTWYEFITIVYAISKIGAIVVPYNIRYQEEESEHIIGDSGAKAIFFTKDYNGVDHYSQLQSIIKRHPHVKHLIAVRSGQLNGTLDYQTLRQMGNGKEVPQVPIDVKEDLFAIIYTSGTTGKPKGVMITHYNMVSVTLNSHEVNGLTEEDVQLHVAPYSHVMGLGMIVRMMAYGTKAVLLESFNAKRVLELIEQEKITVHVGVPTMFILEMNHPEFKSFDLSSLRKAFVAGAPCPVDVIKRIKKEMNCTVQNSYGMTETSLALTYTLPDDDDVLHAETVGKAIKGVELKVVDENRQEVAPGVVGELACRSPGLMKGYYNLPDKTREVIDAEGWFYTGDLATIDEKGYVRIVGRKKEMIIRGGFNIYPSEIEEVFYEHPAVEEAAVFGIPDSVLGEVACAAIVLRQASKVKPDELRHFIYGKLADYKRPDHIILMDELPKTPSGKIMKHILREKVIENEWVKMR